MTWFRVLEVIEKPPAEVIFESPTEVLGPGVGVVRMRQRTVRVFKRLEKVIDTIGLPQAFLSLRILL